MIRIVPPLLPTFITICCGENVSEWLWRRHVARLSRRRRAAAYSGPVMYTTATPPFTCHLLQSIQEPLPCMCRPLSMHMLWQLLGVLRLTLAWHCSEG